MTRAEAVFVLLRFQASFTVFCLYCMTLDFATIKRMVMCDADQCDCPMMKRRRLCLWFPSQGATSVDCSVVLLEPSRLSAYQYDISRSHLPMAASRAFVKDSAALIGSTCLDITELQLAVVALGTGLWCRGPGISVFSSQDLHV